MKRIAIALALLCAPALVSCGTTLDNLAAGVPPATAPLAQTTVDDAGLETAWRAFDASLDAINVLGDVGAIRPGSPAGVTIAAAIRKVNGALQAAERFAAAGSATSYLAALEEARAGINEMRAALRSR